MNRIPKTNIQTLIQQYDVLLLDAYGVLVNQKEALPGAVAFINHLNTLYIALYNITIKNKVYFLLFFKKYPGNYI